MALGIGMCAVNARAVLEALLGLSKPLRAHAQVRRPRRCDPEPAASRRRWRIPAGLVELVMAGVLFACLVLSFLRPFTLIGAPFLLLFALGYAGVGCAELAGSVRHAPEQVRLRRGSLAAAFPRALGRRRRGASCSWRASRQRPS